MRKLFLILVLGCMSTIAFAGYKENIIDANKYYRDKNYPEALKYYRLAYQEKQSDQLEKLITAIEKVTAKKSLTTEKPFEFPGGLVMIVFDCALAGYAAYAVVDERSAADSYDALYAKTNGTNQASYDELLRKQDEVVNKMNIAVAASSVAGLAIIYTLADMFVIKNIFKESNPDAKLGYGINSDGVPELAFAGRF